ncbi:hypothetical protein SAMN02745218_00994 [Desulfofundulus australicus DSM 11792]|uniref:Uncharacterized protein n=1 Tax=Desulfofundulus australicus DSM 11792 TaxID=1121425 RepID=A0A1M4X593_9FIRM|nr:hypothetical protein [Desulfofundulus australicus]SHE88533.1 hypothetical protein SAMN02745218_00994 [Desulfofundulus australicus DSM 11792]
MALMQHLHHFTGAGIKATPVPGTNKYHIQFQDGSSVYVNERVFFRLLNSEENTENVIRILREQTHPPNYPERYQNILRATRR